MDVANEERNGSLDAGGHPGSPGQVSFRVEGLQFTPSLLAGEVVAAEHGRDSKLFAARWGSVKLHSTNDAGPAPEYSFSFEMPGEAMFVITHILSPVNPSTPSGTFFDVTRRDVVQGEKLMMFVRCASHPELFRVLRTRGRHFEIYLGVFPQEVVSVTAVDSPYPFFLNMGPNAFYDHEGFIVEFRVRAFLQDLPLSVEFAGVKVPNNAAVKTIHFTDLEFMFVNDAEVTPKLIPLNTSGSTLRVTGRDLVFGRYREAIRLWAIPRLMPPFKEKCSLDYVKDMWLQTDVSTTTTRVNTTSVGNPRSVKRDPLSESCAESEVTNLCRTTVVLSDKEVECELLPALGSHVDVYLQIYTKFTPLLGVVETER